MGGGGYRWTRAIENFSQLFRPFALRNSVIRQQTQICKSFLEEPHVLHHDVGAVKHAQAYYLVALGREKAILPLCSELREVVPDTHLVNGMGVTGESGSRDAATL